MKRAIGIAAVLALLAGCKSEPIVVQFDTPTSLPRGAGGPITIEDLGANRADSQALMELLRALDRELIEPAKEQRAAGEILFELQRFDLGIRSFNGCELPAAGGRRRIFQEFGILPPQGQRPIIASVSFDKYLERVLKVHKDSSTRGQVQAAWRRFAPAIRNQGKNYLASRWDFEMEFPETINVSLCNSVLGPYVRTSSECSNSLFFGPETKDVAGYSAPLWLANLLPQVWASPIQDLLNALEGKPHSLGIEVPEFSEPSGSESLFLSVLVRGLLQGSCDVEAVPAGVRRLDVEFSYLINTEEARATLGFRWTINHRWVIDRFEYQPASANLLDNEGVKLDVLPLIASLPGFSNSN
ncbi:MAG: hypothetical protein L3J82_06195 [Planctomycetes bacterium]|nr:hypothetical protein [Planctomycetota bacterium]